MHVDRLDPLAADRHGQRLPYRLLLGIGAVQKAAAAEDDAGRGTDAGFSGNHGVWSSQLPPKAFVVMDGAYDMPRVHGKTSGRSSRRTIKPV